MAIILTTVEKSAVIGLKNELYDMMKTAREITTESTFETIRKAQDAFNQAKGLYRALIALDLLNEFAVTQEDIDRIERKQLGILEEKRRKDRLKWKN